MGKVSRRLKAATQKQLRQMLNADLSEVSTVAVMIDGIHIEDHVILLPGHRRGRAQAVLGLWEGATESADALGGPGHEHLGLRAEMARASSRASTALRRRARIRRKTEI